MTLRFEDLGPAIERNDVAAVVSLVSGASEAERRAVNARVRALVGNSWDIESKRVAASIAVLATAGGVRQISQMLSMVGLSTSIDEAVAVLADRSVVWKADLPAALLAGREGLNLWRLVRGMVRSEMVPRPVIPEYTTRMPNALAPFMVRGEPTGTSLEAELLADPGLLEDEVFQLFRVEGAGRSLHWTDAFLSKPRGFRTGTWLGIGSAPEATWRATLARLARAGSIDYDRLLDECINVFLRDLPPTQLGWYIGMHAELAPTLDATAARWEQYARLLAADASIGVGLAQTTLEALLRAGRVDPERFVVASSPALHRAEKGIVLKQLKLLGLVAKQRPDLAPQIAEAISPALTHERPEIREAALAFVGPQPESFVELHVAPPIDPSPVPGGPGARLAPPISDPEELLEVFTKLVEHAGDPVLLERALAGAVRTAQIPVGRRKDMAAPLAKRAREQLPGFTIGSVGGDVRAMLASVASHGRLVSR